MRFLRPARLNGWRNRWYHIIFGSNTRNGKLFDVILLIAILGSLLALMLETVPGFLSEHIRIFRILEWVFTIIFTLEYIARLAVVKRKRKYALSFFGVIDLLSILPTYLSLIFFGAQYFMVIRSFRLLRVFRVLKMMRFVGEARMLTNALRASRIKITVFLIAVVCVVFIAGALMYIIEGPEHGFVSIPISIYWCIVTLTTVGYGDISPSTPLGQIFASALMIIGYGIIAVPTGIVTSEMSKQRRGEKDENLALEECEKCGETEHLPKAKFCQNCGQKL